LIEPKVGKLIQQAREKIWDDPEAALKEVEELAESFGHPETYRALLRFYEVRNAGGTPVLKRAQRLWELTRDSADLTLWQVLRRTFKVKPRWQRSGDDWSPNLDFIEALWRDAGKMNPEFGGVLSEAYGQEDRESRAADVLLEVIQTSEPTAEIVARCIGFLDIAKRPRESADLIEQVKARLLTEPVFLEAWARHAIQSDDKDAVKALVQPPVKDVLVNVRPSVAAQVFSRAGLLEEAAAIGDKALLELAEQTPPYGSSRFEESARLFHELGRWEEFRKTMEGRVPSHFFEEMRERLGVPRRRGGYLRLNKPK
jgi:hypothetical protein